MIQVNSVFMRLADRRLMVTLQAVIRSAPSSVTLVRLYGMQLERAPDKPGPGSQRRDSGGVGASARWGTVHARRCRPGLCRFGGKGRWPVDTVSTNTVGEARQVPMRPPKDMSVCRSLRRFFSEGWLRLRRAVISLKEGPSNYIKESHKNDLPRLVHGFEPHSLPINMGLFGVSVIAILAKLI